jgi:hypothetical protein
MLTRSLCLIVLCLLVLLHSLPVTQAAEHNTLTKEELADGWILLFDGQTDFGWKATSKANWKVASGVISVSEGEAGFLYQTTQFGDFALKVDFRADQATNSGVFLRTSPQPKDPTKDCYELNIAAPDVSPFPTGSFVGRQKCDPYAGKDDWQTFKVTARGASFEIRLDDQKVLTYTDANPLGRGFISLQFNKGRVEFRNIKLQPLGLKSIFSGKDLAGWKVHPGEKNKSAYTVTPEGWINVRNGPGQLESEGQWADFALQLEVFCGGKGLNSGIFFRNIPGEFWQGYESQVHNGYQDGDRTKPVDFGTGAFYRRQPARKIVADDGEWFHKTVMTAGPHMAAWVNGYQVSDWTDTRAKNDNPRNGLRLEKGTLSIQGHDPTTNLSFRNLQISELTARGK